MYRVIYTLTGQGGGMKFIKIICLLAVMIPVASAGADFYRYTDQHGNVIYTDDINQVPDAQRTNARIADDESLTPPGSAASATSPDAGSLPDKAMDDLKGELEQLEGLRLKLKQEFNSLAKENTRLKAKQKTAVTPAQRKAFNKEVVSYNTRFQAYKQKEAAYKSRLEKYYRQVNPAKPNPDN
jgi:hypothetical protein